MREIKFRAWDVSAWTVPFTLKDLADGEFLDPKDFETMKVVQFTGLLDKNGKEIFEGDMVTWRNSENIGVIEYRFAEFVIARGSFVESVTALVRYKWPLEVIGNIYENPELLKA